MRSEWMTLLKGSQLTDAEYNKTKLHQILKIWHQEITCLRAAVLPQIQSTTDKWYHHNHQKYLIVSVLQWNTSLLRLIPWHNKCIAAHLTDA